MRRVCGRLVSGRETINSFGARSTAFSILHCTALSHYRLHIVSTLYSVNKTILFHVEYYTLSLNIALFTLHTSH